LTNALNFPVKDAAQSSLGNGICNLGGSERYCYDGFATKLTAAGALDWSTFIGGDDDDNAHAVALEPGGGLLVAGGTESFDFPVSAGALQPTKSLSRDAFLVRLGSGDSAPPPGDKRAFLPLVIR
jgi:hypothetical protein